MGKGRWLNTCKQETSPSRGLFQMVRLISQRPSRIFLARLFILSPIFSAYRFLFSALKSSSVRVSQEVTMSRAADSNSYNGDFGSAVSSLFHFPETIEKFVFPSGAHDAREPKGISSIPADILDTPKEYIFYLDVPGLSKSDIQVTVEEKNTLVIRIGGKRKREDGEEEGCKYVRLERKAPQKMMRKFKLPENADTSAISAKCENGVLTVIVGKLPPPPKPKTVEVTIA